MPSCGEDGTCEVERARADAFANHPELQGYQYFSQAGYDDQLPRCLDLLERIHYSYYRDLNGLKQDTSSSSSSTKRDQQNGEVLGAGAGASEHSEADVFETKSERVLSSTERKLVKISNDKLDPARSLKGQPEPRNGISVGKILKSMKQHVLRGCNITFSGLIPLNDPAPHLQPLWRLAASLGGNISIEISSKTTHLVCTNATTSKV